ncbi:MAG: hypothetical protein NVS3B24_06650 [Candidatus Dormibacteria bacterium]
MARATVKKLIGLFVGDWSQAIGILVILGLGFAAVHLANLPLAGFGVAAVLAAHLFFTSVAEARRRGRKG